MDSPVPKPPPASTAPLPTPEPPPPPPDRGSPRTDRVSAESAAASASVDKGTVLGLPLPADSDVHMPLVRDTSEEMRSTRPNWISDVLSGRSAPERGSARVPLVPGQTIPGTRYRIDRWLGDGGMGQVYEATHVDLERKVALKVLRHEASGVSEASEMFREEAKRAGKIGSEYIAEVYDFTELADGRLMFAMELLDGHSVAAEVSKGPMAPTRVIGVLRQVCKGLAAAHDVKIIHRDVKPENIMLTKKGGREDRVKLLDFGISTVYDENAGAEGHAAGTAHYVAPELVSGVPYGPRVDMYALGCTAYEMLTGMTPFDAASVEELLVAHVQEDPPRMANRNPAVEVPAVLEHVVRRCMEKRPRKRFADMADLEAALCEAQVDAELRTSWDDLPLPEVDAARKASLLERMPDPRAAGPLRRRWVLPAVLGLAGALVLSSVAVAVLLRDRISDEELSQIELLTRDARAEAAQAYYVYPPKDAPDAATAYRKVLELERLDSSQATEAAIGLRDEFAGTLARLGDQYWSRPGGKPFALDYYAQALVFDPELEQAAARARLTTGQLIALQDKAEAGEFTEGELIAAAPLAALAEPDEDKRLEKMAALRDDDEVQSATMSQQLDELIVGEGGESAQEVRERKRAAREARRQASTEEDEAVEDEALVEEVADVDTRDTDGAKRLADRGWQALRSGKASQAEGLFQQALGKDRSNAEAADGLAKVYFDRSQYSRSLRFAKRAVRSSPRDAEYRIRIGDAYYKLFRYDDAMVHYDRAKELGHPGAAKRLAKARAKIHE